MDNNLKEASAAGDLKMVKKLLEEEKTIVDHQHKMNGWSALHWAAKRNQMNIIKILLEHGADKDLETKDGKKAHELTTDSQIVNLLTGKDCEGTGQIAQPATSNLNFTPNYLSYPPLPSYYQRQDTHTSLSTTATPSLSTTATPSLSTTATPSLSTTATPKTTTSLFPSQSTGQETNELVLKARIADHSEQDFIEIELLYSDRTFHALMALLCKELDIDPQNVMKIRKLPNTVIRKDKDVMRLVDYTELEVVIATADV